MLQYETTNDAFNIKIKNVMNSLRYNELLTPGYLNATNNIKTQETKMYTLDANMHLIRTKKHHQPYPFLPVASNVPLNNVTVKTNISHVK